MSIYGGKGYLLYACISIVEYLGPASYDENVDGSSPKIRINNATIDSTSDNSDSDEIPTIETDGRFILYSQCSDIVVYEDWFHTG